MYCVIDDKNNVIAFHDEENIVRSYCELIYKYHKKKFSIAKLSKKAKKKIKNSDDLYLVRYNDTYIQSGYIEYLDIASGQITYDDEQCKGVLLRILEIADLDEKESKCIQKTLKIIERIREENREYTPTLSTLRGYKSDFDPYIYNHGIIEF